MKAVTSSRIVALASIALVLSAALAACGAQPPIAASHNTASLPSGERLYVVAGAASGDSTNPGTASQGIVAFHPGSAATSPLVSLPMGLTTQDHQRLYVATAGAGQTTITVYDTRSGAKFSMFAIAGAYSMDGRGYLGAVLSPDGRWLVLRQLGPAAGSSVFALVDTQARRLAQTVVLAGDFDLDAISPGGTMLYLLQNLSDAAHHYYVRAYDLTARALLQTIIVDKTEWNGKNMTGTALTRQMAPDGSIAYTLYIDPANNYAFVHILPLGEASSNFPFARCVDLPSGPLSDLLHFYTLTLSPDGSTLYAANAALGVVSVISLHGQQDIFDDQVVATGHFDLAIGGATQSNTARLLYNGATLSTDGKTLYVAGVRGIRAIRTSDLRLVGSYAMQQAFTSVASSVNGESLYAVGPTSGLAVIPLGGGSSLRSLQVPVRSPWGIAWVSA
jgi:DNA-binding beta-propeller fold protein YncE